MNYTKFLEFDVLDMGDKNWCYEDGTKHYHFGDIENCDGVIDIGACYGGFTLAASSRTKADIVAVEPVWDTVVTHNMKKNHISKCKVVSAAVSDKKEVVSIEWNGSTRVVETMIMPEILALLPSSKKLFVKCDCEGGEWNLLPEDGMAAALRSLITSRLMSRCVPSIARLPANAAASSELAIIQAALLR